MNKHNHVQFQKVIYTSLDSPATCRTNAFNAFEFLIVSTDCAADQLVESSEGFCLIKFLLVFNTAGRMVISIFGRYSKWSFYIASLYEVFFILDCINGSYFESWIYISTLQCCLYGINFGDFRNWFLSLIMYIPRVAPSGIKKEISIQTRCLEEM